MPEDHKNDWLKNRFSLEPAGRLLIPGHKGTHLVWRSADVEKAKRLWEEYHPAITSNQSPEPRKISFGGPVSLDQKKELKSMRQHEEGWKPATGSEAALAMLQAGLDLVNLAMGILKPEAAKAGAA